MFITKILYSNSPFSHDSSKEYANVSSSALPCLKFTIGSVNYRYSVQCE
jgi:hypothetical protein